MSRGRNKKPSKRQERFKNVPANKPLTPKEEIFVREYLKCLNGKEAYEKAYAPSKTSTIKAHDLIHNKPNTRKAIADKLNRHFERLDFNAFDILKKLGDIAMCDASELIPIEGGLPVIKDTNDLSVKAQNLYAGAELSYTQTGDRVVKVNSHNQMEALKLLCKYFGILESARHAPLEPITEQKDAIEDVMVGNKTVIEACLNLELKGVPLPETLKILLSKNAEQEETDEGDVDLPTPEEMDKKMQKRLAEIEDQKKTFVPERQEDVRQIKAELNDKDQWKENQKDKKKE